MKQFNITVNGKSYQVDVEEIGGASHQGTAPLKVVKTEQSQPAEHSNKVAAPSAKASPAPAPTKASPSSSAGSGQGTAVTAPMPGTILDIRVNVGQEVKKGDVLMILEAMKMENEIMAPQSGKIIAIPVAKSASVNTSELLVEIQ